MAKVKINGVELFHRLSGSGKIPVILVHGSWVSHQTWDFFQPLFGEEFRVVSYDRRGHSRSDPPSGEGSFEDDVRDLAGLIEQLELAPAWVIGHSFGAAISLRFAGKFPELTRGLVIHEPPLFSLLADDLRFAPALEKTGEKVHSVVEKIKAGDHSGAARDFIENLVLGTGAWERLPEQTKRVFIENAPTFLDETKDPEASVFKPEWVKGVKKPVLLSYGEDSPPNFPPVVKKLANYLPEAKVMQIEGAGHSPHRTQPEKYLETVKSFIEKNPG